MKVAAVQMTSTRDVQANLREAGQLVAEAAKQGGADDGFSVWQLSLVKVAQTGEFDPELPVKLAMPRAATQRRTKAVIAAERGEGLRCAQKQSFNVLPRSLTR